MAVPNKKMYDRKGKLVFDPNNPEDVRRQEELNKQIEMAKQLFSIVDPRGGGGIGAMARGISKTALAKMSKSKFTQNKAKQILELVTKPMTRGKKAASNTRKQAAPIVKEIVETKPTIPTTVPAASDKIKSLSNAEIKAFESVKNVRELAEKQAKNVSTTMSNTPVAKELWKKPLPTPSYTNDGFRIGGTEAKSILSKLKDSEAAKNAAKKAFEKGNTEIIKKGVEKSNAQTAMSIAALTSVIGGGAGATYYGMQLSNKDNKKTTTPQKTGPVDLKRINPSKLKDSNIEGVKTIKGSDGKDYGIQWNNTTKSWNYYRGDKTKKTPETPKPDVIKKENVGGGGVTPIKDNQGGSTKPKSTTVPKNTVDVGKTTAPLMGDEEYKKDPRLATLRQQDDDRQLLARAEAQKKEMKEFKPTESLDVLPMPTKPLSSLMFKTSTLNPKTNSRVEPVSYDTIDIVDTKSKKLRKKSYGGNLAMLKYMKQ